MWIERRLMGIAVVLSLGGCTIGVNVGEEPMTSAGDEAGESTTAEGNASDEDTAGDSRANEDTRGDDGASPASTSSGESSGTTEAGPGSTSVSWTTTQGDGSDSLADDGERDTDSFGDQALYGVCDHDGDCETGDCTQGYCSVECQTDPDCPPPPFGGTAVCSDGYCAHTCDPNDADSCPDWLVCEVDLCRP